MNQTSEIVDLSGMCADDVIQAVEKLLQEAEFERFTLVLKRKQKRIENTLRERVSKRRANTKFSGFGNGKCLTEYSYRQSHQSEEIMGEEEESGIARGISLYQIGNFQQALETLQQEEAMLRESFKGECESLKLYQEVVFHVGNCHYRLRNYEKAVEYYSRRFEGQDLRQMGQKYNNLGSCYAHLEQSRLSLNSYGQALKIYSNFPQVDCSNLLNNLGMLYAQSRMYETAEKYFLQSIEERKLKSPENAYLLYSSYLQLGNCQKCSQKYTEAISSLHLALNFAERGFGSQAETLYLLASIYEVLENWNEALNCYEKLSQTETKKGLLFQRAAYAHRSMGHHCDYDRFIEKALECYREERNERKVSELLPAVAKLGRK